MIVVDIETSGLYPEKHGIWQIGALDFYNPANTFLEEARIDDEDEVTEESLKVTGKTESYLRDKKRQSQKQLLEKFFYWTKSVNIKSVVCQNFFDYMFLTFKARKYDIEVTFRHRAFDLHSIAQTIHHLKNKKFFIKEDNGFVSDMGLSNIMKMCDMEDDRIKLKDGKVVKKGKPHNALEDAKIVAECVRRLLR